MNHSHYAAVGNLTVEPDLRFTPDGKAVAALSWAINSRYRNDRGEWVDQHPRFIRGTAWGAAGRARRGVGVQGRPGRSYRPFGY